MGNLTTTLRPNRPLPPLYDRIGNDMESPSEEMRRRASAFNPKAAAFNPAAASFEPQMSFQQDWTRHAQNLGLPVAPSHGSNVLSQDELEETTGGMIVRDPEPDLNFYPTAEALAPLKEHAVQDTEISSVLFPPDTRVHGLDGGLVQKALQRTLTANELAKYLDGSVDVRPTHNVSPDSTSPRSPDSDKTVMPSSHRSDYFGNRRQSFGVDESQYPPMDPYKSQELFMPTQPQPLTPPAAPRAMMEAPGMYHPTPRAAFPPVSGRHTRVPSDDNPQSASRFPTRNRRVSNRRLHGSRAKRTDQGPMPSQADIYPADAVRAPNWDAAAGVQEQYRRDSGAGMFEERRRASATKKPEASLQVDDAAAWPTPAEALKSGKATPIATVPIAPPVQPTEGLRMHAPEELEVEQYEASEATISTTSPALLMNRGRNDNLLADDRPLSPAQVDGSRYGLRWFGVGYGDDWNPPAAYQGQPFRVRPRNHEGWGGWEWGLRQGWADS